MDSSLIQGTSMKIAIIGTGGVGGYYGGIMAKTGCDVTFLARGEHLKALKTKGLTVKSFQGDFQIYPVNATDSIASIGKVDLILVTLKAWQVKGMAKELATIVDEDTIVLPLQNGVLAAEELMEGIPPENIVGGLCRIISKVESPGVIHHFGVDPSLVFGELDNRNDTVRITALKALFAQCGLTARVAEDIQAELWKKFISNCLSALLAITRSTYGQIREIPETRQLVIGLLQEIYDLSQVVGIKIESDYVTKAMAIVDSFPYEATSSLTRDVWAGNPSEIEYQNGTVVKLAQKYGVVTPINQFVYGCILPMEKKAREKK
jgi:2-dehydropantoate 2-reductase